MVGGEMSPDLDIMDAPSAGHDRQPLAGARMGDPLHLRGQARAEFLVEPGGIGSGGRPDIWIESGIDQLLDMDMCDGLAL